MEGEDRKNLFLNYRLFHEKLFEYEYLRFEKEIDDKHHEFYQ